MGSGSYGSGWVMDLGANFTYVSGFDQDDVDDDDDDDDDDNVLSIVAHHLPP